MNFATNQWLLLIVSLPTASATARMRIWRALRNLGCGSLRDGAYLLPYSPLQQQALRVLAADTVREGGSAWLLIVHAQSEDENDAYRALFERTGNYLELFKALATAHKTLTKLAPQEITKLLRKLRREYEAIREIDYFPNDTSTQAEAVWVDFVSVTDRLLSPDEPHTINTAIARLELSDYKGRTWATRRHLWVDRVASAWLIHRFIDQEAHFLWLESPSHCPVGALGFDFDGATFTHIGDRVTFEVLLASFGLEQDGGLLQLGAMVHALDTGEGFVPEANGFEAILTGARQRTEDDDHLLNEMSVVLDFLYAHFSNDLQSSELQK